MATISIIGLFALNTSAQSKTKRPKVGLVLSGGGAKGIAHIGVLKAMEEAGLTPDYITGTSMGSIVGGLYAAGYSADELKDIVERVDWSQLLSNKIPLNQVTFEEKPYFGRFPFTFYMQNRKLLLPKGIIEGQALLQFFSNLTRHVHNVSDFNKLPIPFACVASDIVTGKPVVLNHGSLALSMRASMAIPTVFTPVKIEDRLLVDGGLVRNMPVAEVLDMGADIVIGVFVSSDLDPEENLTSALSIITQSAFIASAMDTREQLTKCNILIQPDISGIATGSFTLCPTILERGEAAGKAYFETFKKLADSLKQFGPLHKVTKPVVKNEYKFEDVHVSGVNDDMKEFIIDKLRLKSEESIGIEQVERRLDIIYGTQFLENLWFEIHGTEEHPVLQINASERINTQLRFSYHYDSENKGGVVGNITVRNLLLKRSRFIFEADLATFPRLTLDYFKYIGRKQNFAAQATGVYLKNDFPIYDSIGAYTSLFTSNYLNGTLKLQTTGFLNGAFGMEASWSRLMLTPKIVDDNLRAISSITTHYSTFSIFHRFDSMNDRYFPTKGFRSEVKLSTTSKVNVSVRSDTMTLNPELLSEDLLYRSTINTLEVTVFPIVPVTPRLSVLAKARLRLSNVPSGTYLNFGNYDYVGGFLPYGLNATEYVGVNPKEFEVANYFYGKLGMQYRLKTNLYAQAFVNYVDSEHPVTWLYSGADVGLIGDRTNRFGYGASLGYRSPVGPIGVAVGKDYYRNEWKATLMIGFYQ